MRYDGKDTKGSDTFDILLDCSARLALERLEVCTDHSVGLPYVSQYKNGGVFRTEGGGFLAFEYKEISTGLLIITVRCDESRKSEEEMQCFLQQALEKAREYADKHIKKTL